MKIRTVAFVLGFILMTGLGCGGAKDQGDSGNSKDNPDRNKQDEVLTKESEPDSDMERIGKIVDGLRGDWKVTGVYFTGPENVALRQKVALFEPLVKGGDFVVNIQENTATVQFGSGNLALGNSCNKKIVFQKVIGREPCGCRKMTFNYVPGSEPPLDKDCVALAQGFSLTYGASALVDATELFLSYSIGESSINFNLDVIP